MVEYDYTRCSHLPFGKAFNERITHLTDLLLVVLAQYVENFRIDAFWVIAVGKAMVVEFKGIFVATDVIYAP
jgi:hypothetical protein